MLKWNSDSNTVEFFDSVKKQWKIAFQDIAYDRNQMYVDELSYFINCIKTKSNTMNNISHGIETLEIALGILKSSENNEVVYIE